MKKLSQITLPPKKEYYLDRDGVTQSILGWFLCCPMRALLSLNRFQLPGTGANFEFGNLGHHVLEKAYDTFGRKGKVPDREFVERTVKKYIKDNKEDFIGENTDQLEVLAQVVLEEYFKFYKRDFLEHRFVEVERVFDVKFRGYRLRGKKDGMFHDKQKHLWLMEHKFKGNIPDDIADALQLEFQPRFYITAHMEDSDQPVSGVLYNIIRKPLHRQGQKETLRQWGERIRKEIQKDPKHFFIRYEITYTRKEIEQFKEDLEKKLCWFNRFTHGEETSLYRNEFSCDKPYPCQYRQACSTGRLTGYVLGNKLFSELEE